MASYRTPIRHPHQAPEIDPGGDWHIHLIPDPDAKAPVVTNGYFPLPRATIAGWKRGRREAVVRNHD